MAVNPNEDTEFNDALRKHGLLPAREPQPRTPSPPPSPTLEELLDDLQTSELLDDLEDDDTQRSVERYKRKRLLEEREMLRKARFGRVYPIGRDDYTREVTEASKLSEEGDGEKKGSGVVCYLYKDGIPRSDRTFQQIRTLAERYPRTKFVSIVGDKCIPNLPDSRIPMLIVYKNGEILNRIIAWGADRERRTEELEAVLIVGGAIEPAERRSGKSEDDDDLEERSRISNKPGQKSLSGAGDSDSDFEFDL